jgi:hypothetical protein
MIKAVFWCDRALTLDELRQVQALMFRLAR